MAITPTAVITAAGLVQGDGLGINQTLLDLIEALKTSTLSSVVNELQELGHTAIVDVLPKAILQAYAQADEVLTRALAIFPDTPGASGIQHFISIMGGSTSFISISAEMAAALQEFNEKTFSDFGIGVDNFRDILLSGASGIAPGFKKAVEQAKLAAEQAKLAAEQAKLAAEQSGQDNSESDDDDVDYASLQAIMTDSAIGEALKAVGSGLKDLGTLFDFRDLQTLGPRNLVRQLQKQGLADRNGINELLVAAGYDPNDISGVSEEELTIILQNVRGEDLQQVIRENNAKIYGAVQSAADLLVVKNILPPSATMALGIIAEAPDALEKLGNTISNLGVQASNFQIGNFMEILESKATKYLDQVTDVIPQYVNAALDPILGLGEGLFGNPTVKDIIGTVSGLTQNAELGKMLELITTIEDMPEGQEFINKSSDLVLAQQTLDGMDPEDPLYSVVEQAYQDALIDLEDAVTELFDKINDDSEISALAIEADAALARSVENLLKEAANLRLAGFQVVEGVMHTISSMGETAELVVSGAYNGLLSFTNRLHQMGIDKQHLGFNEFLENMVTDNVFGDALNSTLIEGRNMVRAAILGKTIPALANEAEEIKEELEALIVDQYNAYKQLVGQATEIEDVDQKTEFMAMVRAAENAYRDTRTKLGTERADAAIIAAIDEQPTFETITYEFRL